MQMNQTNQTNQGAQGTQSAPSGPRGSAWDNLPEKKQHGVLAAIDGELRGRHLTKPVEVMGHTYELATLGPDREMWADLLTSGEDMFKAARSRRAPYLAAALRGIDGVPVEQLWPLPDAGTPEGMYARGSRAAEDDWRARQALAWLTDDQKHDDFIQALWHEYLLIDKSRRDALEQIGPLSKGTPTGTSSVTSAPEKGYSSQTQSSGV